jgi:putative membrane protein
MTTSYAPFFIAMTPINLMLMFLLLLWNVRAFHWNVWVSIVLAFFVGMLAEALGVNTGLLFGDYFYGKVLGPRVAGVPLLIGLNWFCTVYCAYVSVGLLQNSDWVKQDWFAALMVALMATVYDWVMEPVAVKLGYWTWSSPQIPLYNYVCWFILTFLLILAFRKFKLPANNFFAPVLLLVQLVFFLVLRFMLLPSSI